MSKRTVPDFELWAAIIKGIEPLERRAGLRASTGPRPELVEGRDGKPEPIRARNDPVPHRGASRPTHPRAPTPLPPPPQTGLDRRTQRRLVRGAVEIEAVLDLHGETALTARARLLSFLAEARRRGKRVVLVITGKGGSPFARHTLHGMSHYLAPEREGTLRRLATEWLTEPEFRAHVTAFQPAHPKHGGGGAFYIRLRRPASHS